MSRIPLRYGYTLGSKLGKGSFGEVYNCTDAAGNEFAAKLEPRVVKGKRRRGPSQLQYEYRVYQHLHGGSGIPRIWAFFTEGDYNIMIMDKLGKSIQDVVEERGGKLPMRVVLAIGARMIRHLRLIHSHGMVHRDLKPQNMMLADKKSSEVFLIDFGLSKKYLKRDGSHIPFNEDKGGLTGTPRYASLASHLGVEQGRKDDLESLMYILIFLKNGRLPWQGTRGEKAERYGQIMKMKKRISDDELAAGWPPKFKRFCFMIRNMTFEQQPDYDVLLRLLVDCHDDL